MSCVSCRVVLCFFPFFSIPFLSFSFFSCPVSHFLFIFIPLLVFSSFSYTCKASYSFQFSLHTCLIYKTSTLDFSVERAQLSCPKFVWLCNGHGKVIVWNRPHPLNQWKRTSEVISQPMRMFRHVIARPLQGRYSYREIYNVMTFTLKWIHSTIKYWYNKWYTPCATEFPIWELKQKNSLLLKIEIFFDVIVFHYFNLALRKGFNARGLYHHGH